MTLPSFKILRKIRLLSETALLALFVFFSVTGSAQAEAKSGALGWKGWSEQVFRQAEKEKKLVLLDLEAIWCHWCHVMDEKTYSNPEIIQLLQQHFYLIRADQDAHPDLSSRYKDYGWPATILFDAKGAELRKLTGFVDPAEFAEILKAVIADPRPEKGSEEGASSAGMEKEGALHAALVARHRDAIDTTTGGLKTNHRYLDPTSIEYALLRARDGDAENRAWADLTLRSNLKLIDPTWGGVYQYSTHRSWDRPHFEKIMSSQAANVMLYSLGYKILGHAEYLDAAKKVMAYVNTFLRSPEGAYYVSQDADVKKGEHSDEYFKLGDAQRRAIGMPAIDTNMYARENGWAIEALTELYAASLDQKYLDDALRAANWVVANRSLGNGGFSHGASDKGGPFLGDTLAMGRAFVGLYAVTADRSWLKRSEEAIAFMQATFVHDELVGFFSTPAGQRGPLKPVRRLDDNILAGRFANALFRYTGQLKYEEVARRTLQFAGEGKIAFENITEAGVIMLEDETKVDPPHFTVVGGKTDASALDLWKTLLPVPTSYVRREWWDRAEGPMPNPDVQYPKLPKAAAFVCANKRCSLPLFTKEEVDERLQQAFQPVVKK